MCRYKSAIVLRNGDLIHSAWSDSHEALIEFVGLDDTKDRGGFVRVDFAPDEIEDYKDLTKYRLNLDQNFAPDWWTVELKERVAGELKEIVSHTIVTSPRKCLIGGPWIVAADVQIIRDARVLYVFNKSTVQVVWDGGTVQAVWDGGTVQEVWAGGRIVVDLRMKP